MSNETGYLYITDVEAYLNGDRTFCFSIYDEPPHPEDTPTCGEYLDCVYVGEFQFEVPFSREYLTDLVMAKLDQKEQRVLAEKHKQLEEVQMRKQRLLAITYQPE